MLSDVARLFAVFLLGWVLAGTLEFYRAPFVVDMAVLVIVLLALAAAVDWRRKF